METTNGDKTMSIDEAIGEATITRARTATKFRVFSFGRLHSEVYAGMNAAIQIARMIIRDNPAGYVEIRKGKKKVWNSTNYLGNGHDHHHA